MLAIDVRGRWGRSLREKWAAGARSYLGLLMDGFPNPFVISGPNGPSALANCRQVVPRGYDGLRFGAAFPARAPELAKAAS